MPFFPSLSCMPDRGVTSACGGERWYLGAVRPAIVHPPRSPLHPSPPVGGSPRIPQPRAEPRGAASPLQGRGSPGPWQHGWGEPFGQPCRLPYPLSREKRAGVKSALGEGTLGWPHSNKRSDPGLSVVSVPSWGSVSPWGWWQLGGGRAVRRTPRGAVAWLGCAGTAAGRVSSCPRDTHRATPSSGGESWEDRGICVTSPKIQVARFRNRIKLARSLFAELPTEHTKDVAFSCKVFGSTAVATCDRLKFLTVERPLKLYFISIAGPWQIVPLVPVVKVCMQNTCGLMESLVEAVVSCLSPVGCG